GTRRTGSAHERVPESNLSCRRLWAHLARWTFLTWQVPMRVKFEERHRHPIMVGRGSRFHLAPPQGDHVRLIGSSLWRNAAEPRPRVCYCCGACAAGQWDVVLHVAPS